MATIERNRADSRRERDALAKRRKKAAERARGIKRCRMGHVLPLGSGAQSCPECVANRDLPSEGELVRQILELDRQRELAPTTEWPEFRRRMAVLSALIDDLDRRFRRGSGG